MSKQKTEGLNVISCFDGMGCLMIALKELGIKVITHILSFMKNG